MIKANELRIGNWIKRDENEYEQVDGEFLSHDMTMSGVSEVEGVDLTPEILEKAGFEFNGDFLWHFNNHYFEYLVDKSPMFWLYKVPMKSFKYVHELQNLYFALTREELTIIL